MNKKVKKLIEACSQKAITVKYTHEIYSFRTFDLDAEEFTYHFDKGYKIKIQRNDDVVFNKSGEFIYSKHKYLIELLNLVLSDDKKWYEKGLRLE